MHAVLTQYPIHGWWNINTQVRLEWARLVSIMLQNLPGPLYFLTFQTFFAYKVHFYASQIANCKLCIMVKIDQEKPLLDYHLMHLLN